MKVSKGVAILLIVPFLISCQDDELPDPSVQRARLVVAGDGSESGSVLPQCLAEIQEKVRSGEVSPQDAWKVCQLNPQGVASRVRGIAGQRGFHDSWRSFGKWWALGIWPGYQDYCRFDSTGYSCLNYEYYYPWYVSPSSLGWLFGVDFGLFCGSWNTSSFCGYYNWGGGDYCSECYNKKGWQRQRCLERRGCVSYTVNTITWNDNY